MQLNKIISCLLSAGLVLNTLPSAFSMNNGAAEKTQQTSESEFVLSTQEKDAINSLAANCDLSSETLTNILSFNVEDKKCSLIPIYDCFEHKNCFIKIFSESRPEYMRYYLNGKLKPVSNVESWFRRSVENINKKCPKSITFLVKYGNDIVARIGTGPLSGVVKVNPEIGYAILEDYSGKKIMSNAVQATLNFLQYLKDCGNNCYDFKKIRATAKCANIASKTILSSKGFVLMSRLINDGYGPENEYFYYFN